MGQPRRAFALLAVGLLLAVSLLAGCIGSKDDPAPEQGLNESEQDLGNLSMPDARDGRFNAFDETNRTENGTGGIDHHHDYWMGRTRVELFKLRAEMFPRPSPGGTDVEFNMPLGQTVYEGTAAFEFLVSNPERHVCDPSAATFSTKYTCTDGNGLGAPNPGVRAPDPSPPPLKLYYLHSATAEWIDAGTLAWGTPLVIKVQPRETDMPHSTTSLWRFRVVSTRPLVDSTLTFEASATIVKGEGSVPRWPGHPDFYADKRYRLIYDDVSTTSEGGQLANATGFQHKLTQKSPNRLISYGTRTLLVWINVTKFEPQPGFAPTVWYLYFHNASNDWMATHLFDKENNSIEKTKNLHFRLKVDDAGMDSPYSDASRWEFVLRGTYEIPGTTYTCYSGCAVYRAEYQMKIIATDIVLPDDQYNRVSDVN
ncbi:MAG TPA: hypothetical protein VM889_07000 [Candidatus Thermoplasmatota archaeon]|nr:hypothetical protein [Candidatus Thermoplasmatota archaeon]